MLSAGRNLGVSFRGYGALGARFFTADAHSRRFGFSNVETEEEKTQKVYDVFAAVASKYDIMNDVMSFAAHRCWKDYFVKEVLRPLPGNTYLDMAGGTGDISKRICREIVERSSGLARSATEVEHTDDNASKVFVCDINEHMLKEGEAGNLKEFTNHPDVKVEFQVTPAETLPFEDNSIDAYTISFGLRNVTYVDTALREAHRVLKPGGRFLCMEFSHIENPLLKVAYETYAFNAIPLFGGLIAGNPDAYRYLAESIKKWDNQEQLCDRLRGSGFKCVRFENIFDGMVAIHSGFKL